MEPKDTCERERRTAGPARHTEATRAHGPRVTDAWVTVAMDPDGGVPVSLAVAEQLAGQLGAGLDLVAAPGFGLRPGALSFLVARAREVRSRYADPERVTYEVVEGGDTAGAVLAHLVDRRPDLVCMSTRARHGPSHLLFGSIAEEVLDGAAVPVLFAGPRVAPPARPYRTVIACVDGSAEADAALAVAARLVEAIDGELVMIEVVEPVIDLRDSIEGADLLRRLRTLPHPPADYDVLHGRRPHRVIADYVNHREDVIVVTGTHGRTGLGRVLAGSVARGVVGASCHPTLVVPRRASVDRFLAPAHAGVTT